MCVHSCWTLDSMTSMDILDITREIVKLQLQLGTSLLYIYISAETPTASQAKIKANRLDSEEDHTYSHYVQFLMEES